MSLAYQQTQSRRRQQQVVHHEPTVQEVPARSVTEAPGEEEYYESLGNGERASVAGLEGEGGYDSEPPPTSMVECRGLACGPLITAEDLGTTLQQTEDLVLALGERAFDEMAIFEDASNRWYHPDRGQEQYLAGQALYKRDVRLYQALGLRARADGAVVESVRRLVDEAVHEAEATGLLLQGQGLASKDQSGGLMLSPEDMDRDLALVDQAFATTGYAATDQSLLDEIEAAPAELMESLEVQSHGLSASIAKMRARAVALEAAGIREEMAGIDEVIGTCDRMGELMRLCTAAYRLGQGVAAADTAKAKEGATDLVGEPHTLIGAAARFAYEAQLHSLAGQLTALTASEEGWEDQARAERIRDDLGEYTQAIHAIDEHQQSARCKRDDYVAQLGNLGRTMGLAAAVQGGSLHGDPGQAMENLARIQATHRSLVGIEGPLSEAMNRCLLAARLMGAASRQRPEQAPLITLREGLSGPAELYRSVYHGLEATQRQVLAQREALDAISERFGAIIQRQRR